MSFFSNSEFTITKSIPEFNGFISTTTNYLSVVGTERDGKDVICMTDETTCSFTSVEIPKTESFIPWGGKSILTVWGDNNILNKVIVALKLDQLRWALYLESSFWVSVVLLVAGELPDNYCLVSGGGKDHVGIFRRGSQCCDPAIVA